MQTQIAKTVSVLDARLVAMPNAAESPVPKLTTTLEVSVPDLGVGTVQFDPAKPAIKQSSSSALLPLTTKEYVRLHLPMITKTIVVVLVAALIFTLVAVQSIEVEACNSTAPSGEVDEDDVSGVSSFVGIGIACVANAFNGGGMSLQKVGHNRVAAAAGVTDVNSVGHFKQPMWWLGLVLIIVGEGGNAFAYGLAPASTVAPFGGIGVFTNYLIAVLCLGEKSSVQSIFGICLIAAGVVLTTLAVPESSAAYTAHELLSDAAFNSHRAFWYIIGTIVAVLIIAVKRGSFTLALTPAETLTPSPSPTLTRSSSRRTTPTATSTCGRSTPALYRAGP